MGDHFAAELRSQGSAGVIHLDNVGHVEGRKCKSRIHLWGIVWQRWIVGPFLEVDLAKRVAPLDDSVVEPVEVSCVASICG